MASSISSSFPIPTPAMPAPAGKRQTPNIAWPRPEFLELLPRWQLIRDCVAGSAQVKKRGDQYLPRPNPTDTSPENLARYEQYRHRAVFYGVTGRTLNGLVGQVMAEDPHLVLPAIIDTMEDDIDGGGVSFAQQAGHALSLVTAHGRAGLLVDYPKQAGEATTKAELDKGQVRPTIVLVEPWDVINWRVLPVGGKNVLALVVISEQYVTDDDGFEEQWDDQWRVLRLDEQGEVVIEEWVRDPNNAREFILKPNKETGSVAQYFPTDSAGKPLRAVPFKFIGSNNNDPTPDLPPLYDLATLNIAHFCNSADHEESCYIVGQPTPVFTGLTEGWVKEMLKGVVQLGARGAVLLPEGGDAKLLQADPNTMPKEAMEAKEKQMVALGAKLVQEQQVQRTATEVTSDRAAETSVLGNIANNVSEAYECAFALALTFVDVSQAPKDGQDSEAVEVELNTNFVANRLNAQELAQLVATWVAGAITDEEMRLNMIRAGIASDDFETWKTARDEQLLTKPIATGVPAKPAPGAPGAPAAPTPGGSQ